MTSFTLTTLLLALVPGLVTLCIGGALVRAGRRSRGMDDHPLCRACGFDLNGLPSTSTRCPECGADVTTKRAVVVGERGRRRHWVGIGVVMMLLGALSIVLTSALVAPRVDLQAAKPTWWLMREAGSTTVATRVAGLDRLLARSDDTALRPDEEDALANLLLTAQADLRVPWNTAWGDALWRRFQNGTLSSAQRDTFLRNLIMPAELSVRAEIREGDPLAMQLKLGSGRGGSLLGGWRGMTTLVAKNHLADMQTLVDGVSIDPDRVTNRESWTASSLPQSPETSSWAVDPKRLEGLALGKHVINYRCVLRIMNSLDFKPKELAAIPVSVQSTFSIRPRDTQLIEWITDESVRPALEKALQGSQVTLFQPPGSTSPPTPNIRIPGNLPVAVVFRVTLRQGDQTWDAHTFAAKEGSTSSYGLFCVGKVKPGKADLIFTPDEAAAISTVDITRAWKGDITIRDVRVRMVR